ncbi:HD-GYP domain-containing protein [Roseateles sp. DAIF2]|uniref:HD-GYP domain-containing protein n=1 Tax=Roseateles sp. DAIF2 TaxID=2714952 RepID=UPI00201D3D31|nr:HD-GYP domain-containing protein [Roseateles sp. DAIF2]
MLAPQAPSTDRMFDAAATAQMERIVMDLGRMYHERNEALREVSRAHHEALLRLSLAADFKDDDTGVHIIRIGYLAEALALMLGQPAAYASMLSRAAPMHDIGKIGVPDAVLKKPGSFNPDERAAMNQHPRMGAEILGRSRIPLFQMAAEVALGHHERWDGGGYPSGLVGEAIPLSARIVAVVDYFDALTMDRCYRKAFANDVALGMLAEQRGKAFDPAIVDVFLANAPALLELRDRINRQPPSFEALVQND